MAVIHITEAQALDSFASLLAQATTGTEIVIERGSQPIAVLHMPDPPRRTIEESLARITANPAGVTDADFAADVQAAIAAHREPLNPPAWD